MKKIILSAVFLISLLEVFAQRTVVLLIADDLGTDYFGFYEDHGDTVAVPNIRSLLRNGVRFQNAMSNPVCSATRSGMLTGRYGFRTGVGSIVGSTAGSGQISTTEITIPRLLQSFNPNLAKANIGKWHLSQPNPASNLLNPNVLGYDHFEGPFIGAINDYYNWQKYTNGVSSTITTYATTENVNNAVSWIKGQTGKPVFLWMAFNAPHSPFHLPPAGLYSDLTLTGTPQQINANPKRYFKASIEALDHEIGRLFDSLQVLNRLDSTDFIFMGDNGNALQTAQIANVNQAKGTIYQYGVHVPFLVAGPSVVNPGRVSGALVNTVDVFATVLELFGYTQWQTQIPPNKPVDSKSLLPILKDETSDVRPWAFTEIFTLTGDPNDGKAIRNSSYKLMKFDAGSEALFNLNSDAGEAFNLLNGTLTPTELTNYQYLCGEMTNLVGTNGFCNPVLSSLPNKESNPFSVYPNPAKGLVVVKSDRIYKEGISCELLDLLDRKLVQTSIPPGGILCFFETNALPKGQYMVRITDGSHVITKKVQITE